MGREHRTGRPMIDFSLTEEHLAVQSLVKDFCAKEVLPNIRERDRAAQFDPGLLDKMGKADLLGLCLPKEFGGAGMDYISLGLTCEEAEYADTSVRVIFS